jgi:hypothetical protein
VKKKEREAEYLYIITIDLAECKTGEINEEVHPPVRLLPFPAEIKKSRQTHVYRLFPYAGGEGGIRTLDTVSSIHTFQACSFDHSDTSPYRLQIKAFYFLFPNISDSKIGEYADRLIKARQSGPFPNFVKL